VNADPEPADGGGFNQIEILIQLIEVIYHCAAGRPFGDRGVMAEHGALESI